MKVKPAQMTALDSMQMMSDPATWGYYNMWDIDPLGVAGPSSPDSDSEQEDASPPLGMFPSGTPADIAASMAVASMATGLPPPGTFSLDDVDVSAPLSNSEKDVLNELVHELGIASNQPSLQLPQPIPGKATTTKPSAPSSVASPNTDSGDSVSTKPASPSRTKKERPVTPDLDEILAKPVKSQKPVDVEAVMERNRKNAIQARINRQKKKQQMDLLEDQISKLEEDKRSLEERCSKQEEEKQQLQQEVLYLRSVLANQSMLSGLLKNINHTEGLALKSSGLSEQKRPTQNGDEPVIKRTRLEQSPAQSTAGVCLHVDKDLVSLEFCEKCAKMAKSTGVTPSFTSH